MAAGDNLMRLLGYRSEVLVSRLSPSECSARLRDAVASPWAPFSDRPVKGFVSETGARLWKRLWYRNSFQTIMTVRFQPDGTRTRLQCRWGMGLFNLVFVPLLIVVVLFLGVAVASHGGAGLSQRGASLMTGFMPLLLIAFLAFIVALGRLLARGEGDFLRSFVAETTEASPTR